MNSAHLDIANIQRNPSPFLSDESGAPASIRPLSAPGPVDAFGQDCLSHHFTNSEFSATADGRVHATKTFAAMMISSDAAFASGAVTGQVRQPGGLGLTDPVRHPGVLAVLLAVAQSEAATELTQGR